MSQSPAPSGERLAPARVVLRTMTLPAQANLYGGVFGGWILSQFDLAAGLAGQKFAGPCLTRAVNEVLFHAPLRVGEEFVLQGHVGRVGRTSFTLELEAWAEPDGTDRRLIAQARFTMVCIDSEGHPRPVEPVQSLT